MISVRAARQARRQRTLGCDQGGLVADWEVSLLVGERDEREKEQV